MDCKYVRETLCLCFTFHPNESSIFSLTQSQDRLRVVQENLYTGLITNEFPVPLKEQNLDVDNYRLTYCAQGRQIILTLCNHVLVYSEEKKVLVYVGEAQGKLPYYIDKAICQKNHMYFTATDQNCVFAINLAQCIQTANVNSAVISNYTKFKIVQEVGIIDILASNSRLIALCFDYNLRVWDTESNTALRGATIQKIGLPRCFAFSKNNEYLLIGTEDGYVQVWDGNTLGVVNTVVLCEQLVKDQSLQSVAWFHYSGESQSRRFLVLTSKGSVKLYSFFFEKLASKDRYMGKSNELSLLYIYRKRVTRDFSIRSHDFANFIFFSPGILLYMVDFYPIVYYPAVTSQLTHTFESLIPNDKKEVYWQSDFIFISGVEVKKISHEIHTVVSLQSILEYAELKILKMDYRPKFYDQTDILLNKPLSYKILISYYFGSMVRSLVLSRICFNNPTAEETVQTFKQYSGHSMHFLGPLGNIEPLLLILQEDRQTITVLCESPIEDSEACYEEQRKFLRSAGELYSKQLKIKIQRIFSTPFRSNYVLVYQSQNLLRFSNNIQTSSDLLDYDVFPGLQLRLDYTDIIIDLIWTARGELGCVVCLDKVIFINEELKIVKYADIRGYVVQGQFVGFTVIVTTKVDVQYVDVSGHPLQLYCIQNYENKYLILGILVDRIIGVEKNRIKQDTTCKSRYFNLMEPLLAGYLTYHKLMSIPINQVIAKRIIQCYAPYHIVSEPFLQLLNSFHLHNFSKYFIESHAKLYSRAIRSQTLNSELRMERFVNETTWIKHKAKILDIYLQYEENKDSQDNYQVEKCKESLETLSRLISGEALASILQASKEPRMTPLTIVNSFGEQSLAQIFYSFNRKENAFVKMQIQPFKAENIGEWVGLFPLFIQSKVVDQRMDLEPKMSFVAEDREEESEEEAEKKFKNLLIYYRCDQGKGETVNDLSGNDNGGTITSSTAEVWNLLPDEPMELIDTWGKKCPPQYSLTNSMVTRDKKIHGKHIACFTFQLWLRATADTFDVLRLGEKTIFGLKDGQPFVKNEEKVVTLSMEEEGRFLPNVWNHMAWTYSKEQSLISVHKNCSFSTSQKCAMKVGRQFLQLLTVGFQGEFTEFRFWRKTISLSQLKETMRSPLQLVAERQQNTVVRIREKKKKAQSSAKEEFFPVFEL